VNEIAVLEYRKHLIVSVQYEITDTTALNLQDAILKRIEGSRARGLVIDISALGMVDSFIARVFMETAMMARLMNARTVIAGMKPEIAMTLIQMGFSLEGVQMSTNLESGLELLEAAEREEDSVETTDAE
jgi:rsbT antagonist protein RsbS